MLSEQEFLRAYEEYADRIFRHCYYRVFDRERARELMQETFLKTWQSIVRGTDIHNLKAFLYRVANNLVIDESRKKKELFIGDFVSTYSGDDDPPAWEPSVDDRARLVERIDGTMALEKLEQLDPSSRAVLLWRYVDGLRPKEIAELTGESPNVISVRLHRAVRHLKKLLAS